MYIFYAHTETFSFLFFFILKATAKMPYLPLEPFLHENMFSSARLGVALSAFKPASLFFADTLNRKVSSMVSL